VDEDHLEIRMRFQRAKSARPNKHSAAGIGFVALAQRLVLPALKTSRG